VLGDKGALSGVSRGTILVDNTTASANVARELHGRAGKAGASFIDAPISGGQAGAENGVLTVMCGVGKTHFNKVQPVIDCYARQVTLIGGLVQGLSEGDNFGMKAGLDM